MRLYTIGFTRKSARTFFDDLLGHSGAARVLDVRARPSSQLAGFAKVSQSDGDFQFLLNRLCGLDYAHLPELAPTTELLSSLRAREIDWREYRERYLALIERRHVAERLDRALIAEGVLLCSEASPEHCHRRLAAEFLQQHWGDVDIVHL